MGQHNQRMNKSTRLLRIAEKDEGDSQQEVLDYESHSIDATDIEESLEGIGLEKDDVSHASSLHREQVQQQTREIEEKNVLTSQDYLKNKSLKDDSFMLDDFHSNFALDSSSGSHVEYSHHHGHSSGLVRGVVMLLVFMHLAGVLFWLRAWLKDRNTKGPTMRAVPPPLKQTCTYDIDRAFAISKVELPLKALNKLAKS
eukprot:jgi/Picsp_1/2551/NSC_00782-R1_---NA---